jgi:hypothetical protein
VEFIDRTVVASDLAGISSTVTTISFVDYRSKEWVKIGERLAALQQLKIMSAERCDPEDNLCAGICGSKSLTRLRMGKWYVTQRTAMSPIKEFNNCAKCNR